jgi:hypothetical protein
VLGWIIAAVVVIGIIGTLFGISRSWRKDMQAETPGVPEDALVASFVGGVKWNGGNATVPLARLDVHRWGIRITGSWGPLRRILPHWEVLAADVSRAQLGKSRFGGSGICFGLRRSELVFRTSSTASVSVALAEIGVEVDQTPREVPFTYP